ncbi:hypothetical protein CYLTODRAFT_460513 [Cylindrobasidium torrendii FP15055 ss-10]|uniref:Uncharacterized protein n=1 Tax=Cylindrobasidium torrendii FP15055 ss-10 TaxID=1314674 RepID=A0A0D7AR65_9AGAR|nr:hypothetical protein CYLTODRAFT_460513 [Cylindrobasidium torrendii FP15055 ss-10]
MYYEALEMPLDPEPPSRTVPLAGPSIAALRDLIHGVALPKSPTAKSCSVPIDTWKEISSTVSLLAANATQDIIGKLSSLTTQIENLQQHVLRYQPTQAPQPKTTTSSPVTPILNPPPMPPATRHTRHTACDLVLSPSFTH